MHKDFEKILLQAITAHQSGDLNNAEASYKLILKEHPKHCDANHNLGVLISRTRGIDEAKDYFDNAIQECSSTALYWETYISELMRSQNFFDALSVLRKANSENINSVKLATLSNILSQISDEAILPEINILMNNGDYQRAQKLCTQALKFNPHNPLILNQLGVCQTELENFTDAISTLQEAIQLQPTSAQLLNNLGIAFLQKGNAAEAIKTFNQALSLDKHYAKAYENRGTAELNSGKRANAVTSYLSAIELNPKGVTQYLNLSHAKPSVMTASHIDTINNLLISNEISNLEKAQLRYSKAKYFHSNHEFDMAFNELKLGGNLRQKAHGYSFKRDEYIFNQAIENSQGLEPLDDYENQMVEPIFIIGMPRSGTTLLEQLISSHPLVSTAGELSALTKYGGDMILGNCQKTQKNLRDLKKNYLNAALQKSSAAGFIVDKMPQNFLFVPLIFSIFPDAKVINISRDARETCWSNFFHYFRQKGFDYSFDIVTTIKYFIKYRDTMKHWNGRYPNRILNITLETLVNKTDSIKNEIFDYLNLDYDDKIIETNKNNNTINTASNIQARQPISKNVMQNWTPYFSFVEQEFSVLQT